MNSKEEVLQKCRVKGNIIKLPDVQLERKLYQDVAKSLELIGGKWKGGKTFGFVFPSNPTELLEQIANGEKRNLKKEYQFFATPADLADELVQLANINDPDLLVLEPSAGQGAIVNALLRKEPELMVHGFEIMDINQMFLKKINNFTLIGFDFLEDIKYHNLEKYYDRIVANPPFTKNQDIDHIRQMYRYLKAGGRLVSMSSNHWHTSSFKKETEFKEWLHNRNANCICIEPGRFKESGTNIATCIIIIDKPLN
jgi:hypothetical protein